MTHTHCCLIKHLCCTIAQVKSMDILRYLRPELSLVLKVKGAPLCPTICDCIDYMVHGILQARILEWVAFPFSRGSSQPRDPTQVSCIAGRFFSRWATGKSLVLSGDLSSFVQEEIISVHTFLKCFSWCLLHGIYGERESLVQVLSSLSFMNSISILYLYTRFQQRILY